MKTDNEMVFVFLSLLAVAHCTDLRQPTASGGGDGDLTTAAAVAAAGGDQATNDGGQEHTTAEAAAAAGRTGRKYYQPSGPVGYAYQSSYPQRRAYKGPGQSKKRPLRSKTVRRRPTGPRRRPAAGPPSPLTMAGGRYFRRLPPRALRGPPNNYIDSPPPQAAAADYDDDEDGSSFEPSVSSFDYGEYREVDREPAYVPAYVGPMSPMPASAAAVVVASPPFGRQRKRPLVVADEPQAVVHVPVRVQARPVADPMEKLRQMVHEAMDEHFANKHRELYVDGFGGKPAVYSAKYKRQQQQQQQQQQQEQVADKDRKQQRSATVIEAQNDAAAGKKADAAPTSDADADGTDDRLTLAEISAYMGAKPAETVLSAGGHRYVLSDALQHAYRQQQQLHHRQPQQLHQQQQQYDADDYRGGDGTSYLRYVSPPIETIYGLPAARWTYK